MDHLNTPMYQKAISGLAIVGFVTLVSAGIWLALYSTRFVPPVVNGIGAAAVYLGSVFTPASEPGLSVIPTPVASTTISFPSTDSGQAATETNAPSPASVKPTAGARTNTVSQISGTNVAPALSGLSDLTVHITAVGYLSAASADSFIASSTVPAGSRPAVRFTIKNIGTNIAGPWRFSAYIPTQSSYLYQSQLQQSLNPGDSIDYTLGFDQAIAGTGKLISITANFDHTIGESNTNNNNATTTVTILGS
ncbi:MAG: CARDB domain-containing protein [bacterium]|nr:CARDB domain-containing protein [bacterium]